MSIHRNSGFDCSSLASSEGQGWDFPYQYGTTGSSYKRRVIKSGYCREIGLSRLPVEAIGSLSMDSEYAEVFLREWKKVM